MDALAVLTDGFGRVKEAVHEAVDGLAAQHLELRVDPAANTIAWLVWHLARVQDDHVSEVARREQAWTAGGWDRRFDLPFDAGATGYGQSSADVAAARASADLLTGYYDAVHEATLAFLGSIGEADLDVVVDRRWDPAVTLGARLVSILADDLQHAGQAALLRGVAERLLQ